MGSATFKGIGTTWYITTDNDPLRDEVTDALVAYVADFEQRFSRFLPHSEVNAFREAREGRYEISEEFARLLSEADRLRTLTDGVYDPAAGELLERAGYDAAYTMREKESVSNFSLPVWSLRGRELALEGPTAFDLGGIGKGYCIDRVVELLMSYGYEHVLVDAGGDMFGSTRSDGSPWRVAIQYPGKPDTAAGMIALQNAALAVSDVFRRRWGRWHHVIDPHTKEAVHGLIGAASVTPNAWHADCMTSALFLGKPESYPRAAEVYAASYLVFHEDGACLVSKNWEGELY